MITSAHCASKSKLVIARVLGGAGYWKYGFEQYAAQLHAAGVPFAALPGDDKPDAELRQFSTVSDEDYDALWAYFVEGGPDNAQNVLRYAEAMLEGTEKPAAASHHVARSARMPPRGISQALRSLCNPIANCTVDKIPADLNQGESFLVEAA